MTTRRFGEPGDKRNREWHTLGACTTFYVTWQASVALGIAVGAQVPAHWSLDFAVVLTFISLLVPVVRKRADLAAAVVAAVVALAAAGLPYRLALVVASLKRSGPLQKQREGHDPGARRNSCWLVHCRVPPEE